MSEQPAEPLVQIYVVNGTRTSQGPGPAVKTLPASEANALISHKYAVASSRNPEAADPEPVVRAFPHVPLRRPASSN